VCTHGNTEENVVQNVLEKLSQRFVLTSYVLAVKQETVSEALASLSDFAVKIWRKLTNYTNMGQQTCSKVGAKRLTTAVLSVRRRGVCFTHKIEQILKSKGISPEGRNDDVRGMDKLEKRGSKNPAENKTTTSSCHRELFTPEGRSSKDRGERKGAVYARWEQRTV
jgi:hypothetical protein